MEDRRLKIAIVGAGNVASHLAVEFSRVATVCQVVSKISSHSRQLAEKVGKQCQWGTLSDLIPDADIYIISVGDDAISDVVDTTENYPGVWAHTSGSVPADIFRNKKSHFGVFYPLQTFTKGVPVNFSEIPLLVEGSTSVEQSLLASLAAKLSDKVIKADSSTRAQLHVAAVFACNFANLLWMEADALLHSCGMDIKLLMPLLEATMQKLRSIPPAEAMTGPARRGDYGVINTQMHRLHGDKLKIYKILSNVILERFGHSSINCLNENNL